MAETPCRPCLELGHAEAVLRARFGHRRFRPGQRAIVCAMLSGADVLAVQPTGSGKSICFQVPALVHPGLTVVVSPLISLMQDQVAGLRGRDVPAAAWTSLSDPAERERIEALVRTGALRLLYVSPERLERPAFQHLVARGGVARVVVDEAHCVSEWGHDFRPSYRRIRAFTAGLGRPPVAAFTATATARTRHDIERCLGLSGCRRFVASVDRPTLRWEAACAGSFGAAVARAADEVRLVLRRDPTAAALLYALTRDRSVRAAGALCRLGLGAAPYHGGMPGPIRQRVQGEFLAGRLRVVCATSAFGMGIDHPRIRIVCHAGCPPSLEAYVQEAGRGGRDGRSGRCLLLGLPEDRELHRRFVRGQWPPWRTVAAAWSTIPADRPVPEEWVRDRLGRRLDPETATSALRVLLEHGCVRRVGYGPGPPGAAGADGRRLLRASLPGHALADHLARGRRTGDLRSEVMWRYLRARACRRAVIARYFGERPPACHGCDRCVEGGGQP